MTYVPTGRPRGWNLRGPHKVVVTGGRHREWKGDDARPEAKRARAQRMYALGACERCGCAATDRHHIDGDTGNNVAANIALLCRRCHMTVDGRLDALRAFPRLAPQPPKPCANCAQPYKPLRKGRCAACAVYLGRTGRERPNRSEAT